MLPASVCVCLCVCVCFMHVFTEHECVSMSLEMAARASGTPSCQLPLFSTTHTHTPQNIYSLGFSCNPLLPLSEEQTGHKAVIDCLALDWAENEGSDARD